MPQPRSERAKISSSYNSLAVCVQFACRARAHRFLDHLSQLINGSPQNAVAGGAHLAENDRGAKAEKARENAKKSAKKGQNSPKTLMSAGIRRPASRRWRIRPCRR